MKLLVIEDNLLLIKSLKSALGKYFVMHAVRTGKEGIEQAESENYDAIILDLGLPDKNGEEVCKTIRASGVNTPILVVTATADVNMKVKLLEMGADDYITKPFSLSELHARLRAIMRREPAVTSDLLTVGTLTLDPASRRVKREGKEILLRRKEFDILEYLARNRGKIVTRPMIINHVWETGKDSWNNTVDVHIKYLRDKVDRPFAHPLIKTAYGIGYVIEAPQT